MKLESRLHNVGMIKVIACSLLKESYTSYMKTIESFIFISFYDIEPNYD